MLSVGNVEANVTVTGDATILEAARSQIAGTVSQDEIRSLPLKAPAQEADPVLEQCRTGALRQESR